MSRVRDLFIKAAKKVGFVLLPESEGPWMFFGKVKRRTCLGRGPRQKKPTKSIDQMLDEAMAEAGFGPPVCVNCAPPKKRKKR